MTDTNMTLESALAPRTNGNGNGKARLRIICVLRKEAEIAVVKQALTKLGVKVTDKGSVDPDFARTAVLNEIKRRIAAKTEAEQKPKGK
jgi:hypothetical protein